MEKWFSKTILVITKQRIEKADHGEVPLMAEFENYLKIMGDIIRKK